MGMGRPPNRRLMDWLRGAQLNARKRPGGHGIPSAVPSVRKGRRRLRRSGELALTIGCPIGERVGSLRKFQNPSSGNPRGRKGSGLRCTDSAETARRCAVDRCFDGRFRIAVEVHQCFFSLDRGSVRHCWWTRVVPGYVVGDARV